jgi:hypothetical protein
MSMSNDLKFGDVVFVPHKLHRTTAQRGGIDWKEWHKITFPKPKTGILIGFRTLADGVIHYGHWDEPTSFAGKEFFRAALVAMDAKSKPILVRLEDVTNEAKGR